MPVVTAEDIWSDRKFPKPGYIACQIVSKSQDGAGREIAEVITEKPWGIETSDGTTTFQVFVDQLTQGR
jgi:hypothetical protein